MELILSEAELCYFNTYNLIFCCDYKCVFVYFRKSPEERGGEMVPTPAARPSLRDMHLPQPHAKSTIEEDVKRHAAPDSPPPPRKHKEKVCTFTP